MPTLSDRCGSATGTATEQSQNCNHPTGANPADNPPAQALTGWAAPDPIPERRTWRGWMRGETGQALGRCSPFPTPHRLAQAYRERFGRPPGVGCPGLAYRYTRAEVLELARWLQERQAAAVTVRFRRGVA